MTRSAWLRAYAETGVNDYTPFESAEVDRRDDFNTYGADIGFTFGKARLSVGAWTTDYDSNILVFDRTTNGFRANFGISTGGAPWG